LDTLYLQQTEMSRANMFTVPYGSNYALFYSTNTYEEYDVTTMNWKVNLLKSDESGWDEYTLDPNEEKDLVGDALLYFDVISDGNKPTALYTSVRTTVPVYMVSNNGTTYVHRLREVQKPQACSIGPNRYMVTWWSAFYSSYDITTDGYTDDKTKMIRTSNTERPAAGEAYKRAMLSSFMTFVRSNQTWTENSTNYDIKNVLIPVFTKPELITYENVINEEAGGGSSISLVQAQQDGASGVVPVLPVRLKADYTASPNFETVGATGTNVYYFKL
jgi:hypothetical protein